MIRPTGALEYRRINTFKRAVGPRSGLPRVFRSLDGRNKSDLRATNVDGGDVPDKVRRRAPEVEAHVAIVPGSVALHSQLPRISVIDETLLSIAERHAVAYDVICRRVIGDAKLVSVAVAVEIVKVPSVESIAPCIDFFYGDRGAEHEEVESVINIVP